MDFADLYFADDGTPKSARYDDYYFSNGQGIAETEHVFIEKNQLPERFRALPPNGHFTVAETGFGTGLNFLVAWRTFLENAPKTARLTFISCEKHPIDPVQLAKTHENWPELQSLSTQLQAQYPPALQGYHLLEFNGVNLILIFDDAMAAYKELTASVDAWFLDGFTPSRNPDMWQPDLFHSMSRLSHLSTTIATFTAARIARDGLTNAGFRLEKLSGFGKKRHMMRGVFIGVCGPKTITGWPTSQLPNPKPNLGQRVAIIGAGIAGATTAVELSKRGFNVTLFDRSTALASGGSGNPQGAVYAKLSAQPNPSTVFYAQALVVAQRLLAALPDSVPHQVSGLAQLAHNPTEIKRLRDIAESSYIPKPLAIEKTAAELSQLLKISTHHSGLWFENGGWVSPPALVHHLITNQAIDLRLNTDIQTIQQTLTGWLLNDSKDSSMIFDQVVLASAHDTLKISQTAHLPLTAIAGQITSLTSDERSNRLHAVICTDRYVMPALDGTLTIGSTFRLKSTNTEVNAEDHQSNIDNLKKLIPQVLPEAPNVIGGRAAVRCTTPDYLPLVGAISEPDAFRAQFKIALQKNRAHQETPARHLKGLWVNVGHGSKGLCSSHLCAKLLAAMMTQEPYPVSTSIAQKLNPNRFLVKALLKERRIKNESNTLG